MPARDSLLDAAYEALRHKPWRTVRMVDVAAAAGVSRQTLYNEFGSKDGLARALVRRETDTYLAGADRALAEGGLSSLAEWTVVAARSNALVHALLTGCWSPSLPSPPLAAVPSASPLPAQRRAAGPLPSPGELLALVRDRAAAFAAWTRQDCDLALRLALSCVLAPAGDGGVRRLVRETLGSTA
ncbi:TetR/AcrR family transcriptional regulator [Streptomyces sp. KLOTTS4A1]|uniref:TetR/AcrR family transcriptional regulator n=1 Tax=Streptomyces sp. KLOTTS4A1 TaxID=3390996 RepID=UPI0039F4CCBA